MSNGMLSLLIVVLMIVLAFKTKRSLEVLTLGSLMSFIALYRGNFLTEWISAIQKSLSDNVWIFLLCGFFGCIIALLEASGGSRGFERIAERYCSNPRRTKLASFLLGTLIFVDDYLNVMTVGICMKKLYDRHKIPREMLAYVLDSTGAPICVLLPFSTWAIFFSGLFAKEPWVQTLKMEPMKAYIHTIPFLFYPIFAVILVFLLCMGWIPNLGPMRRAYARTGRTGVTYGRDSAKYNILDVEEEDKGNVFDFLLPVLALIIISTVTGDVFLAVIACIGICFVLYIPRRILSVADFTAVCTRGFADMLPVLAMLLVAFTLQKGLAGLGLTDYLLQIIAPGLIPQVFPALAFFLVAVLTFTTGSNWGMSAVAIPVIMPMGAAVGANVILAMAAIISGGAFGSHACFYADATLLSSQVSGIENMDHALTQFPYVVIASSLAFVTYLIFGFLLPR
nr:Na+/H+ antiporter NhaC family protein [uncultured Shuttleworthia sp.]